MSKKIRMIEDENKLYFILPVETLEDLKIYCDSSYHKDRDVTNFWNDFSKGDKTEFCLTEAEFIKYYLKGGDKCEY